MQQGVTQIQGDHNESHSENGVIVIDFGSQYTQLIARRIRELGVFSEIVNYETDLNQILAHKPAALILSGGPCGVGDDSAPHINPEIFSLGIPILGLCYGMQLTAHLLGGQVGQGEKREYGPTTIEILEDSDLFSGFSKSERTAVWMSHGDHVDKLPAGFQVLSKSTDGIISAMGDLKRRIYGLQFHPEVIHTPRGVELLSNFIFRISECRKNWDPSDFLARTVKDIKERVPSNAKVICGLSGGVDSTVAAVLVSRAVGDRLHCIMVDNGLLRKGEAQRIYSRLGPDGLGLNVTVVDASEQFLTALKGVTDPEKKRKIIGHVFIDVFDQEARRVQDVTHLVQGTLYPDVIESSSVKGPSVTIKTHHNVGGLPKDMKLDLIEPFRDLFKDEVRRIGRTLDIPAELIDRHPFPGPGLAVRILGEITPDRLRMVREADRIFHEEIRADDLYKDLWQSFTVLLPVRSVGVMGDSRTYEETVALRAVTSEDGMTADWAYLPEATLRRTSKRIINEVKGINRVVLDISSKPPATIEWE